MHTFLWEKGRIKDLGTLGGSHTDSGSKINARGQIAGSSTTATGATHAFLWERGA
ncbi:MAG: hypothetical protein KF819_09865 [Labilithrix sp.]|nr:hypothetical protein [Labilithrix sp.]